MKSNRVPEFAVIGHPNEGKSAVVSTLSEDDSVRVSPYPGETLVCQTFPVSIDGREIIRFTDTPGFQNPKKILAWMRNHKSSGHRLLTDFREVHIDNPDFREDCELFEPVVRGAGIIYVVDGSRPVRKVDLAEMEILRLTGRPRMAIINCKEDETGYLEQWKGEFRKHFNAIRVFNAHKATYAERIELLENLKSIDQDWAPALETVISAFRQDWQERSALTAELICNMLEDCLGYTITRNLMERTDEAALKRRIREAYDRDIEKIEKKAHQKIRRLFKHNIFNYELPPHSILHEDLFAEKTWQVLGLTPKQLIAAAAMTGGAIGAALDIAAAGLTFGIFSSIFGLLGAGWAALGGGKRLARTAVVGMTLGSQQIRIGPIENIQFMYVLLDRALIYYSHIINWAHGRRDYPPESPAVGQPAKTGYTTEWNDQTKRVCNGFYSVVRTHEFEKKEQSRKALKETLQAVLLEISQSERQ